MADLHNISWERKLKAFEQARDESNIDEGKLVLLTEEYYAAALNFARDSFCQDEPISKALQIQWCDALAELWLETFRCHMTLAILNNETDNVIAIRGIRVLDKNESFDPSAIPDVGFQTLWKMMEICNEEARFLETFHVHQAFQFFGFAVHETLRHIGLGGRLFQTALKMLEYLVPDSFCIKGETSSMFSSRIYKKYNFVKLYELPYAEYMVDGKQAISNTGKHTALKIYGIKINK